MGIVNVTPDSFSDGGEFLDPERAIAHGRSWPRRARTSSTSAASRPGPARRPSIGRGGAAPRPAGRRGARPASDSRFDRHLQGRSSPRRPWTPARRWSTTSPPFEPIPSSPGSAPSAAARSSSCTCSATRGRCRRTPSTTTSSTTSRRFWRSGSSSRSPRGSTRSGSGSTPGSASARRSSTTSSCIAGSGSSRSWARPIAFGSSRKSFIGKLTGAEVDQRIGGTIASNVIAYANGARMLRVHDVAPDAPGAHRRRGDPRPERSPSAFASRRTPGSAR